MKLQNISKYSKIIVYLIVGVFTILYSILGIVRYNNFEAFGYDLGINSQTVWRYSTFQNPVSTLAPFPELLKLSAHVELIYALISPFYWIWNDPRMLLILQVIFVCSGAIALYKLSEKKRLNVYISLALVISYLMFYGVQNALWFDVHSSVFAAGVLAWFIYLLETKRLKLSILFFILAITAKENIAIITFAISIMYLIVNREKKYLIYATVSIVYLLFIYFVYFPQIVQVDYLYENSGGLLSGLSLTGFFDSQDKRDTLIYSFLSFGFLPLLLPVMLLPMIADLSTYFILASELTGSHGLFMHYRVTLAPLMVVATIYAIAKFKWLNKWYLSVYLLIFTLFCQYYLHLPLSYLTKQWFWTQHVAVANIQNVIKQLPEDASVVSQNNISPRIAHRDKIYTLYPEKKVFEINSPCDSRECNWFRWHGSPEYLIVDTSENWDIRHLLANRDDYIDGLINLEKEGYIKREYKSNNAELYKIIKNH